MMYDHSQESFTAGLKQLFHGVIKVTLESAIERLSLPSIFTRSTLPTPLSIKNKLTKISWVDFSVNIMQVPEGLVSGILPYTVLISNDGLHLVSELKEALLVLNKVLNGALRDEPIDFNLLSNMVTKHVKKQDAFYASYSELVKDNGLSHRSIADTLHSPAEVLQWHSYLKLLSTTFNETEAREYSAILRVVSTKLTAYIDKLSQSKDTSEIAVGRIVSNAAYALAERVAIINVVALSLQMNHRSMDLFLKQLMKV